jgi:hypothetical protein
LAGGRRFETYLIGSVMVLLGLILVVYLFGFVAGSQTPPLFLIGVGAIFSVMAVLKARAPAPYEMPPKTTLSYGVLALVIGVLWISVSIQAVLAAYLLASMLVFFGLVFLAYTRIKRSSS